MLAKGLIFLCIGVYATCMPMIKRSPEDEDTLTKINEEIQKLLGQIITELNEVPSQQLQGMCKNLNKEEGAHFKTYVEFLEQSVVPENLTVFYNNVFQDLRNLQSLCSQNGPRNMTDETGTTRFLKVFEKLLRFMKELFLTVN